MTVFFVMILYAVYENNTVRPSSTPVNKSPLSVRKLYINISHSHMKVNFRGRGPKTHPTTPPYIRKWRNRSIVNLSMNDITGSRNAGTEYITICHSLCKIRPDSPNNGFTTQCQYHRFKVKGKVLHGTGQEGPEGG
jgi:hypothetical protein